MRLKTLIKKLEECYSEKQQAFWCEIPDELAPWILKYLKELERVKNDR